MPLWRPLHGLAVVLGLLALAALVLLPATQVVMRGFGRPIIGLEEATRYGLIWLTLIAVPVVIADGGQIRMGEFVDRAPPRLHAGLARLTALLSAAVLAGVVWSVLRSMAQNVGSVTPTLGIPFWLFMLPALLGFAAGALAYVLVALGVLRVREAGEPRLG